MTRTAWRWSVIGLVVLVLVATGLWLRSGPQQAQPGPAPATPATAAAPAAELAATDVVRAQSQLLQRGLPISGSLRAVDSAVVKARVAGELQGLLVREGDTVRAGQVLARIDPTEVQARLQQAQEQADAARAQIEIAQRQWSNNKALVDQGFISRTALEASWNNLAVAEAQHKAALAAVALARKALDDAELRAPIAGQIASRLVQPGERVGVDTKVVEIVDLRRLELEAVLPAADSVTVRVGQAAQLRIEGHPQPVAARVVRISPSAQPGSRSVPVYLAIADPAGLRQGLFAQGLLATGSTRALAVPLTAVRTDQPVPYVQVVEADRVAHRAVQPGLRGTVDQDEWVAVTGVAEGAQVLRGHVGALREGLAVRFTGAATAAPGPASDSPGAATRTQPVRP